MVRLVLGGARSGKSRYAQSLAKELTDAPVMLATSLLYDDDHAHRVARHKAERGAEWTTVEEPRSIARPELAGRVVVVDCVTTWLNNVFADAKWQADDARHRAYEELSRLWEIKATWILVSNELGMAPHAMTEAGRKFVDLQGWANQAIAARADVVTLLVAGLPLVLKGNDDRAAARAVRR